jgi:glycosyltransferase involved in cell wall biosynthesis
MKPILLLLGDRLVFVAHKMQKFYLGEQPTQNTKVIYEPVDLSRFQLSNNSKQKGLLEALNLSPENTIVGSIGNITPAKGWFYFIDAAEIILKSQPNARFVVVGSESTTQRDYAKKVMAYLEAKNLNDKFVLTGYRNDIPDLLSIFDIFMMASIEEGTPISILEAMAMKVPVIATNVGGIEEQVIHNKTGLLVESRNSQALAESCLKLIGDRVLKERLTVEARQYVEKNFSLQKCVKEHYLLYKGLIKN